jgi:hypothetical protein
MIITEPLLETVRDILRDDLTNLTQTDKSIRITNDRKVPSYAGEEFINVFGANVQNLYEPSFEVRRERYGLKIGITRRFVGIAQDVSAESIYTYDEDLFSRTKQSMLTRAHEIITLLDGQWGVPALIRQMEELEDYSFCILTPLGFESAAELEEVWAEHFRGEDDGERPQALFLELSFGGLEVYTNKF